ncbi:MAG: aspartyl protease family protein [Paludibacteraceae bacterium]
MKKYLVLIVCLFLFFSNERICAKNKRIASVPFRLVGSYVVLDVAINNSRPLSLILDTGVESTIITELNKNESITFKQGDSITIKGLGIDKNVNAIRTRNNDFKIGILNFNGNDVTLILDQGFNLSGITGERINGIIGSDILKEFIVEINYATSKLIFYSHEGFTPHRKFISIPVLLVKNRLYANADIVNQNGVTKKMVMLIDTGAEVSAWLQTIRSDGIVVPKNKVFGYIGEGLNGEINGYYAYMNRLCLGPFCIKNPIATFPDSIYISQFLLNSSRDGTLGNKILKRFNQIIDYQTPVLYLRPNFMFYEKFSYNIAGIELIQSTDFLFHFRITKIWPDSPADLEGIKEGDLILEIDRLPIYTLKINEIREIFETPRRLPLHMVIQRDNDMLDFFLDMRSPI